MATASRKLFVHVIKGHRGAIAVVERGHRELQCDADEFGGSGALNFGAGQTDKLLRRGASASASAALVCLLLEA